MTTDSAAYLTNLHQLLNQHFNLAEIQDLCFRLNIDYESVPGDEKPSRIRALLLGLGRHGRLPELIAVLQQQRPTVTWPPAPDNFQLPESLASGETAVPANQYHVYGDVVHGDKIAGDKLTTGDVAGRGIAIGSGAKATYIEAEQYVAQQIIVKRDAVASIEDLPPTPGDPPYKGMQYFDVADADLFFGRERLTAQIINRLHQTRFLAIIGASGSGKSSLLRAGVVAALQRGRALPDGTQPPAGKWSIRIIKPSSSPLDALAVSLMGRSDDYLAVLKLRDQLATDKRVLPILGRQLLQTEQSDHLLLAVDQFEELFTLCKAEDERRAFLDILLAATSPETDVPITVIVTLRADFYADCAAYEDLRQALSQHQEYIGAMNQAEMYSAITRPLIRSELWEIQEKLPELILDELGNEPGVLALLSHALVETWARRRGHVLTLSGYQEAGGVRGAIAKTAENVYCHQLSEAEQPLARNIFVRLTELGDGTHDTRRRATYSELLTSSQQPELVEDVVKKLANARLVVTDQVIGQDERTVEVAHEVLIRHWSRLREWLSEDRDLLRLRLAVHRASVEWKDNGQVEGYLVHRDERLKQVIVLLHHPRVMLDEVEQAYLEACQKLDALTRASIAAMGWGVIFAWNADPAVRYALRELLEHRRQQATDDGRNPNYYRELFGADGFRPNETKSKFLARHGVGAALPSPDKMPYYLLIVGDPETIPFSFQYQLDMQYAVGRIHFDTLEEYAQYARSVVTAETTELTLSRRAVVFAPQNNDDRATAMGLERLATPLADSLEEKRSQWQVERVFREEATKANLSQLIAGDQPAPLLFTCGHGMQFALDHERQLTDQGALLCQDWPGPRQWQGGLDRDFYYAGADVPDDAHLLGSVIYIWGCFGAATPKMDNFNQQSFRSEPQQLAPYAFISRLPQRLLGHAQGGALAFIGSVERKWGYSFSLEGGVADLDHFMKTLLDIMDGYPVGVAMETFNQRYASLMSELVPMLERSQAGEIDPYEMARMWTATNDARNYIIIGDPAVRLRVGKNGAAARPAIEPGLQLDEAEQTLQTDIDTAAVQWEDHGRRQPDLQHQGEALATIEAYGSLFQRQEPAATYLKACRLNEAISQAAQTWDEKGRQAADLVHLGQKRTQFEEIGLQLEKEPAMSYIAACRQVDQENEVSGQQQIN